MNIKISSRCDNPFDMVDWKLFLNDLRKTINSNSFREKFNNLYTDQLVDIQFNDYTFYLIFDDLKVVILPVCMQTAILDVLEFYHILSSKNIFTTCDGVVYRLK